MKLVVRVCAAAILVLSATTVFAQSRYQALIEDPATREVMRDLALWEDQRVTGDGALFAQLESPKPLLRVRAVEVIGRIQDPQDVPHLLPLLSDPDERVVDETIFALGQIGSPAATAPMVEMLASARPDRTVLIAEALGKIGDEAAVAALIELLRNYNAHVRGEAALALMRAGDKEAVNTLLLTIHDPDPSVAWKSIHALEKFNGDRPRKQILSFLDHDDARVRAMAARTAGKQKNGDAQDALIELLNDKNVEVVVNAARALGEIMSKDAIHPLGEVVRNHKSHHARRAAASALGAIGSNKAKDHLIQAILDPSAGVRVAATLALAEVLGNEVVIFCNELINDGNRYVRAAALEAKGTDAEGRVLQELMSVASSNDDPMMRFAAIRGISRAKDKDTAGPFLISRLADPDWVVVSETVGALAKVKPDGVLEAMVDTYLQRRGRQDVNIRVEILRAFSELDATPAVPLLEECLSDNDPRIRSLAWDLLQKTGSTAAEPATQREFYTQNFDRSRRRDLAPPSGLHHAVISTRHGDIEMELYGDDAPQTVAHFMALAKKGFYDGLVFHRVVPNYVVQGGDPRGDSWGDAGYYLRSEFNRHQYGTGFVGVAHDGKDTGGCQFFVTLSPQRKLDGLYTVFGHVTRGMNVVWLIDQGDEMTVKILD